ncbi:MAG: hypothetical protein FJY07_08400 [Bacteroidetes bacterium]|nr:hypothetical protein [Bacteroidota bacterium]
MTDDLNKLIIKYFLGPLITLIFLAGIISSIFETGRKTPSYRWITSEETQRQYREQENEWYRRRSLDNTYHGLKRKGH